MILNVKTDYEYRF